VSTCFIQAKLLGWIGRKIKIGKSRDLVSYYETVRCGVRGNGGVGSGGGGGGGLGGVPEK